ncbi:MAG: hypothetical protein ABSF83_13155 [Nitrososphaerales archaeon]|jgi:hypothetical protein
MRPASILGWTGNGSLEDLARTAVGKLGEGATLERGARSLVVRGVDPVAAAHRLDRLPGVAWIAAGYDFEGLDRGVARLSSLASSYLGDGGSFRVTAEVGAGAGVEEGDVLMEATSALLKAKKGAHLDEKDPSVWFRMVLTRKGRGVCGVQLREGPGGVPTARGMAATCLVSGGYHSAVVAWMAALSGYSLALVHSRDGDDGSLRQVARLYAELSHRMDPAALGLRVLGGKGTPGGRLVAWLGTARGEVFAGAHPECRGEEGLRALRRRRPSIVFPLFLLQEAEVGSKLRGLALGQRAGDGSPTLDLTGRGGGDRPTVRTFGGVESDQNAVLDSILAQG